jgi:RNA polymerase sigma factor (sigma-70 family)
MTSASATLSARLARLVPRPPAADADLLARFTASRDGEAFAELVRRHGPAVLATCRRVTGNAHDADDAFQAAFLVLARRATQVRSGEPLGAWLYGVAVRVARKAARRREVLGEVPDVPARAADPLDADAARAVAEEVGRLSPRYRAAVVLCELEGRPRAAAARELGIAPGTLSSRLAAARRELAERLSARGFGPPALAALAPVVVPPELSAAATALPGQPAPAAVAALATGVLRTMLVRSLPPGALVLGLAAALTATLLADRPAPAAFPAPVARAAVAGAQPPAAAQPTAPKAAPRPLPKSPNRILVYKSGHLTLIDPDGKNEKRVSHNRGEFIPGDAKLSPDGKQIAFLVQVQKSEDIPPGQDPRRKLYLRTLGEAEPGTDTGLECHTFEWSPDGSRLAACVVGGDEKQPEVLHYLIDGKTGQRTTLRLPSNHLVSGWAAGDRLVTASFTGTANAAQIHLHLMNPDGTEHKQLTGEKSLATAAPPVLAPDRKRVLCWDSVPAGKAEAAPVRHEMFVLDLTTGRRTPVEGLPLNGEIQGCCWSPDGSKIAYTWRQVHERTAEDLATRETESYLVVADPDGKNARTILTEKGRGLGLITLGIPDWR